MQIKKLPGYTYWSRGYEIFYEDGRAMVFDIMWLKGGEYGVRYMIPAESQASLPGHMSALPVNFSTTTYAVNILAPIL